MQPLEEFHRVATITLRGMWNQRWIGLATAWLVAIVAFVAVSLTPERYEASARIFVNTDSILRPLMTGLTVLPNDEQRIALLSRVVISRPNVERLIKEVGLDKDVHTSSQRAALVDSVFKRLTLKGVGRENLYTLSFRDPDAQKAKLAIELMAEMFMSQGKGGKTADTEAAKRFLDEQIAVYEQKLREAEDRLKQFRTDNLGMAPGEGRQDYFTRMAETERLLSQARLELREAERARDAFKRGLQSVETSVNDGSAAAAELAARIDAMRRTLDTLLQRYTEDHPEVQGNRRMLAELEAQRAKIPGASRYTPAPSATPAPSSGPSAEQQLRVSLAQSEASVASLSARVAEYTARYDKLRASATLVPKLEAELAQLNRDYEVNKKNYEGLVTGRESATISGEMQTVAGADFRLVDPPRVSPNPVFPNHKVLYPMALIGALCAGLVAAYVAREVRPAFYDGRSLRDATGLPLLGVISLSITDSTRLKRRAANVRFVSGLGALVGVYLAGFVALEFVLKGLR
jgi:polysaccharide chain length determinant protein (PEP-CTERM system associated)